MCFIKFAGTADKSEYSESGFHLTLILCPSRFAYSSSVLHFSLNEPSFLVQSLIGNVA